MYFNYTILEYEIIILEIVEFSLSYSDFCTTNAILCIQDCIHFCEVHRMTKVIFLLCTSVDLVSFWTDYDQLTSAAGRYKVYCSLSYYIELDVV